MDKLLLGRYIPGHSWIHELDPRTKLIARRPAVNLADLVYRRFAGIVCSWRYGLLALGLVMDHEARAD